MTDPLDDINTIREVARDLPTHPRDIKNSARLYEAADRLAALLAQKDAEMKRLTLALKELTMLAEASLAALAAAQKPPASGHGRSAARRTAV